MDADLTCPRCDGKPYRHGPVPCRICHGTGRRQPTLSEWDALRTERDRYLEALEQIASHATFFSGAQMIDLARAALDRSS